MRSPALIAAHQAADVVAALLLYDDEGHFGDVDVVEKLAEALALSIDLRRAEIERCDHGYLAALDSLKAEATTFINGFAG